MKRGVDKKFLNIYQNTLYVYFPNQHLYGVNIHNGELVYTFDYESRLGKTGFIIKELRRLEKAAPIIDPEEGVIYTCYYGRGVVLSLDKPRVVRTYPYRERNSVNENKECKESHKEVNVLFFPLRHPRPSINAPEEEIMEYFRKIELHQYYNINWEGNNLIVKDKYLILGGGIYDKKTGQCIREALIYGDIIFYDDKRIYSLSTLSKEPAIYCYEFIEGKETP